MKQKFPKQLWFNDYPEHSFEFLEKKNIDGYALYICKNSNVEKLKRVHTSYYNGKTKVAFFSQKDLLEFKIEQLERNLQYWKYKLKELK